MTSLKTSIKTITYLSDTGCLEIQGASLTLDGDIISLLSDWGEMLFLLILYCLGSMIIVLIFDFIAEYFLFMKDMKMDKQEVKREYKEQEGNPEIKSKRRERIRKFFLSN